MVVVLVNPRFSVGNISTLANVEVDLSDLCLMYIGTTIYRAAKKD